MHTYSNIDEYIAGFPDNIQQLLVLVRKTIQQAAPEATEAISYGIPTFQLHGNLVHFAGYKNHIGFYPGAAGIAAFQEKIAPYKNAKGSVQFPISEKIPLKLIKEMVIFRVQQNMEKRQQKTKAKKS